MFLKTLLGLYSPLLPEVLVGALRSENNSVFRYLRWFHGRRSLKLPLGASKEIDSQLVRFMQLGMIAWAIVLIVLILQWLPGHRAGYWAFALSMFLAYPLLLAYGLALFEGLGQLFQNVLHPKRVGRKIICNVLEWQVRSLRKRHRFTVVAVAGSVGKTSTKMAIAELLGQNLRVRYEKGNYNDRVTVPLVFFGRSSPSLLNPFAWARMIGSNQAVLHQPYPYDVVVVELGTDAPGQMRYFSYIRPDITVVTGVTPEHMENFRTLDAVAREELQVAGYSKTLLVNLDDIPAKYFPKKSFHTYGLRKDAEYVAKSTSRGLQGQVLEVSYGRKQIKSEVAYIGKQGAKFGLAAVAVADLLGIHGKQIAQSITALQPFAGRMQVLDGIRGSKLIDDSYNSTPIAAKAALEVLYAEKTGQRIAVLGSMNELGDFAREAHEDVGRYCDANKLDMVVTVGVDARRWIAPAAKTKGCTVHSFLSPYQAGNFVLEHLQKGAVVLAKGSQNGVFTEEALKKLLAHPADASRLVRQSRAWQKIKAAQFKTD